MKAETKMAGSEPQDSSRFASIESAIADFAQGQFLIVLDSPSRENEGDLIIAAQALTAEKASFMIHHTSAYLCAPMRASRADRLNLPLMVPDSQDARRTAYTITVDAVGTSTGISATDRSLTCRVLADADTTPERLIRPGHVVPLRAVDGGLRVRQGHTEAAVELCALAGLSQVGVIGELVDEGQALAGAERSGTGMMRRDECLRFGERFGIRVITIEHLLAHLEAGG